MKTKTHCRQLFRRFVAFLLAKIYGVRGGLKPPLGGPFAGRFYPVRYRWWKEMSRLYNWSGLPDRWEAWYRSQPDSENVTHLGFFKKRLLEHLEPKSWRCFHCDEVFTDSKDAATHFGTAPEAQPVCAIKADEIRHMEWCLEKYRNEDTDLHRQINCMQGEHAQALMRAEESGYSKGLQDGRALASGTL